MRNNSSYTIINYLIAGLIGLIFLYVYCYPWLNPMGLTIPSGCHDLPLAFCKSRGLTRGFAQMIRFNYEDAIAFNPYCWRIFSFFLFQFIARISLTIIAKRTKPLFAYSLDLIFSIPHFAYSMIVLTPFYD